MQAAKAREDEEDTEAPAKMKKTAWQKFNAAKAREDEEDTKAPRIALSFCIISLSHWEKHGGKHGGSKPLAPSASLDLPKVLQ